MVATEPAHQRRGYAEAAMRHALEVAAGRHGERTSFLHATDAGRLALPFAHAERAIARAVLLGERDEVALGTAGINVPLASAEAPAIAHVLPLARRDGDARFSDSAAAAIFISVAGVTPTPAIEAIATLFGLTPAEKRVVGQVADGKSRKEIALSQGVSDGTVKTQLSAIFDKTGMHDRRQLELLIREVTPPVLPPSER
jgi:DNA-binding CsgD family transcriptional regulator